MIVGYSVGIFSDWTQVTPYVTGCPKAQHKSYKTLREAKEYYFAQKRLGNVKLVNLLA